MLHAKRACGSTWRKPRGDWKEKKVPPRSLHNMKGPIGGGPTEECGEGTVMGHPCWSIYLFFSSGMADVALWLGPYMSINCQNYICTRTQKVHKCRQIKSHQTTHKTHNQDDPQIPQPDLRFVKKNSKPDRQRGKSPNNKTHKKDLPRDTADFTTVSHSKTCIN